MWGSVHTAVRTETTGRQVQTEGYPGGQAGTLLLWALDESYILSDRLWLAGGLAGVVGQ